jgi:hypothetical protein
MTKYHVIESHPKSLASDPTSTIGWYAGSLIFVTLVSLKFGWVCCVEMDGVSLRISESRITRFYETVLDRQR